MDEATVTVVFAGYETMPGHGWPVLCLVRALADFVGVDLNAKSVAIDRRKLWSHAVKKLTFKQM